MQEEEIGPAFLQGNDDRLLDLKYEVAEVRSKQEAAIVPAQDEARGRRLSAYMEAEVGPARTVAREGLIVLPKHSRRGGVVAGDLHRLANNAEAEACVRQSSHRATAVTALGYA